MSVVFHFLVGLLTSLTAEEVASMSNCRLRDMCGLAVRAIKEADARGMVYTREELRNVWFMMGDEQVRRSSGGQMTMGEVTGDV